MPLNQGDPDSDVHTSFFSFAAIAKSCLNVALEFLFPILDKHIVGC